MSWRRFVFIGIVAATWLPGFVSAIPATGQFDATRDCPAPVRITQATSDLTLQPGRRYPVSALNKPGGGYIRIYISEAHPPERWVALTCGHWIQGGSDSRADPVESEHTGLKAFFDDEANPVSVDFPPQTKMDITPPPPKLNEFDQAVLRTCGAFGASVPAQAIHALLKEKAAVAVFDRLRKTLGCDPFPGCRQVDMQTKLTDIWSRHDGFKHIFCGEPGSKTLAGMHYAGRYLQAQQHGWAGLLVPRKGREEIKPGVVYSVGSRHRWHGKWVETKIKGYPYHMHADDLFVHGTVAFFRVAAPNKRIACSYTVATGNPQQVFTAVYVGDSNGIRTFYPDLTSHAKPCR